MCLLSIQNILSPYGIYKVKERLLLKAAVNDGTAALWLLDSVIY